MEKLKKITLLLAVGVVFMPLSMSAKPRDLGAFSNVRTSTARMPFYKGRTLEYFLRSRSMAMRGRLLDAAWPMIDSIRPGISVESIAKSDNSSDIYDLNAPLETVTEYWSKRAYSDGVVVSESATLDQANRTASGSQKVFLRSPMLDLNGVGFTADLARKTIKINSAVEIVLRNEGNNSLASPLEGLDGKKKSGSKKGVSSTRAFCDEMLIDTANKTITLLGNVRVFDQAGTITSERLEIEFGEAPGKTAAKNGKKTGSVTALKEDKPKLRIVRFIGKVHAVRKLDAAELAAGEQYAQAERIVYNAQKDVLEMTGKRPRLVRGKDSAEAERVVMLPGKKIIRFFDKCLFVFHRAKDPSLPPDKVTADYADWNYPENLIRLIGHTHLRSPADKSELQADRLEITLADRELKNNSNRKKSSVNPTSGKRPAKSIANGNVKFKRDNNGVHETARAGRMIYQSGKEELRLENKPVIQRGNDIIRGGEMTYLIEQERMLVKRSSHIALSGATVNSANASGGNSPVTVDSKSADLNYGGNNIAFDGSVAVRGRGMKLDSDKLDITLKDVKPAAGAAGDVQKRKQPVRALAVGNVRAEDKTGILDTGVLDVRFGDTAVPGKVEIEKIFASQQMRLQSKPDKVQDNSGKHGPTLLGRSTDGITALDAERGTLDLLKHEANFYNKVAVYDSQVKLECEHLKVVAQPVSGTVPTLAQYKARDEFPDRLAVGEGRELVRIVGNKDVKISRTLPSGEVQRAKGDQGVYIVKERKVFLTCVPPNRPQALTADSGMVGDKVTIELDSEELYVENGDVLTRLNDMKF